MIVKPAHQITQTYLDRTLEAPKRLLFLRVMREVVPIRRDLGRAVQLHPELQPGARRDFQVVGVAAPAIHHAAVGELEVTRGTQRQKHILGRRVTAGDIDIVEMRARPPAIEYAHDANGVITKLQRLAGAVLATEQLVIELAGNHRHPRLAIIVSRGPWTPIQHRRLEHRKEIGGGVACIRVERIHAGLHRLHWHRSTGHQRLPICTLGTQKVHAVGPCQLIRRLL